MLMPLRHYDILRYCAPYAFHYAASHYRLMLYRYAISPGYVRFVIAYAHASHAAIPPLLMMPPS